MILPKPSGESLDVFTKAKRSEVMRRVRSRDTGWELGFRRVLWKRGLHYRTNYGPFRIDIAFPGQRLAVFLDSCFWHFCPQHGEIPATNTDFWLMKFHKTRARDAKATRQLSKEGWVVVRLWSHDFLRDQDAAADLVSQHFRRLSRRDRVPKDGRKGHRQRPGESPRRRSGDRTHR